MDSKGFGAMTTGGGVAEAIAAIKGFNEEWGTFAARYKQRERQIDELQAQIDEVQKSQQRLGPGVAYDVQGKHAESKAFVNYLRTGEGGATREFRNDASLDNGPSGGYTAPPQFAKEILKVGAEVGVIRNLARSYSPSKGDFRILINTNLADAAWVSERGPRSLTTTPSFAEISPAGGGIFAVAAITNWLLDDSDFDLAQFVTNSIGEQFGQSEDAAFVSGNGVGKPEGFTVAPTAATADATRPFGTVEDLHSGDIAGFDFDDLLDLISKLAPRYRRSATWVMHPNTEVFVRKIKNAVTGDFIWEPSTQSGTPPTLLGMPCYADVNMPEIGDGNVAVALADWKRFYAVADIGATKLLRDPYTQKGQVMIYAEKRIAGHVIDSNAGKFLVTAA